MDTKNLFAYLSSIKGQFTPSNLSSRIFINEKDMAEPQNYLTMFHERFHHLQMIFTPYGQLKWGSYRTNALDIINTWKDLKKEKLSLKIPIKEYLSDESKEDPELILNILAKEYMYDIYNLIEFGDDLNRICYLYPSIKNNMYNPKVSIRGLEHEFRVIDILESYAKFEEAIIAELAFNIQFDKTIDPDILNPEYYDALYYYVEKAGAEHLFEFPIACELSLMCMHIPNLISIDNFKKYAPNWRFIKIVDVIKNDQNLPKLDIMDNNSFIVYCNYILDKCNFESIDECWTAADEYAISSELSMAKEMKKAIDYKKKNPWMLSYPMRSISEFTSKEYNQFKPFLTILNNGIFYNLESIRNEELIMENHIQALSQQICGYQSKYSQDSFKMMCGYSYLIVLI